MGVSPRAIIFSVDLQGGKIQYAAVHSRLSVDAPLHDCLCRLPCLASVLFIAVEESGSGSVQSFPERRENPL